MIRSCTLHDSNIKLSNSTDFVESERCPFFRDEMNVFHD